MLSPTVSSKHLWPEFEIMHEYESEFDIEISHENSYANSLVCKDRMDDSMKSLLANFEVLIFFIISFENLVFFLVALVVPLFGSLFLRSCLTILKN